MKKLNGREMKTLFILSIVVPVGLLTTFRLTGILREQPKKERVTLEPVTLTLSRPNETTVITNRSVQNEWLWEEAFISALVSIVEYREGPNTPSPYNGHDGLMFATRINASSPKGLLGTIKLSFHLLDGDAVLFVSEERWALHLDNATLIALRYLGTNRTDAYIQVKSSNSSSYIGDEIYWVFLDDGNESHELQIIAEIVYASKTSIEIITIPMRITLSEEAVD